MVTDIQVRHSLKTLNTEILRMSPYFQGLDDTILENISRLMKVKVVEKHEVIWLEQEPAKTMYFVASGLIKLFKTSPGGREQILRLIHPGDCFGHAGVFNGGSNPESAQAIVPSVLYGISENDLRTLLVDNRQLADNTIKLLATEMHYYMSLIEDLSLRCVSGRLAKMLLTDNNKSTCDTSLVLTRSDMAAMTGTVREVIGKSLKALEDKGVIRYDRHKIVIRDREALQEIMQSV
jgi:CRP-like cAMP-binding protein